MRGCTLIIDVLIQISSDIGHDSALLGNQDITSDDLLCLHLIGIDAIGHTNAGKIRIDMIERECRAVGGKKVMSYIVVHQVRRRADSLSWNGHNDKKEDESRDDEGLSPNDA